MAAGVPWDALPSRGPRDGLFLLISPEFPKAPLVEGLPEMLARAVRGHNSTSHAAARVRLRLAIRQPHPQPVSISNRARRSGVAWARARATHRRTVRSATSTAVAVNRPCSLDNSPRESSSAGRRTAASRNARPVPSVPTSANLSNPRPADGPTHQGNPIPQHRPTDPTVTGSGDHAERDRRAQPAGHHEALCRTYGY